MEEGFLMDEDEFKFVHMSDPNLTYKAKKMYDSNIYIVMWLCDNDLECLEYQIKVVEDYIQDGTWIVLD